MTKPSFYIDIAWADSPEAEILRRWEARHGDGTLGYLENYETESIFVSVRSMNDGGGICSLARITLPTTKGLRFEEATRELWGADLTLPRSVEVGSFVVHHRFAGQTHTAPWLGLWQAIVQIAKAHDAESLVMLCDVGMVGRLQLVGFSPWHMLGSEQAFGWSLGTLPLGCVLASYKGKLELHHETQHDLFFIGKGLERVITGPKTWRPRRTAGGQGAVA